MNAPNDLSIDEKRKRQTAYEYLCRLEEIKLWLEHVLEEQLPSSSELDQYFSNGVTIARLAHFCCPEKIPLKKIFDNDLQRYQSKGLHFRHTDNINLFISGLKDIGLPKVFYPETIDIYDMKNTPKLTYCLHALSYFLARLKRAPLIQQLSGKVQFTDDEILKVQTHFEKYGIQMPAFSKIGGILAEHLSENEAALHASIMLINEALDVLDEALLLERLKSPNAQIERIRDQHIKDYMKELSNEKILKVTIAEEKKKLIEQELDVYDTILTHNEIQSIIDKVNLQKVLNHLTTLCKDGKIDEISQCLFDSDFGKIAVLIDNSKDYPPVLLEHYKSKLSSNPDYILSFQDVDTVVKQVNEECLYKRQIQTLATNINDSLKMNKLEDLIKYLNGLPAGFPPVDTKKKQLCFNTLKNLFQTSGAFTEKSLTSSIKILSLLCSINTCIDNKKEGELVKLLISPELNMPKIEVDSAYLYLEELYKIKIAKQSENGVENAELELNEIQTGVTSVNITIKNEADMLNSMAILNEKIKTLDDADLLKLLQSNESKFNNVDPKNIKTYNEVLKHAKYQTEISNKDPNASLWHDAVQSHIDQANMNIKFSTKYVSDVEKFNKMLLDKEPNQKVIDILKSLYVDGIIAECNKSYLDASREALSKRNLNEWNGWLNHFVIADNHPYTFWYNYKTREYRWVEAPTEFKSDVGYLNRDVVQTICNSTGSKHNREMYFKSNLSSIETIRSWVLTSQHYAIFMKHLKFVRHELPQIIIIQSYARLLCSRPNYINELKFFAQFPNEAEIIKSFSSSSLLRLHFTNKLKFYESHSLDIIALQSLIRSCLAHNDYNNLVHQDRPQLRVVQKYINLLEYDANDLLEEQEVARLRGVLYDKIGEANDLEQEVKDMDIKIGLLVKNRINLSEVLASNTRQSSKGGKRMEMGPTISKEKLLRREKYGYLLHILQTQPAYMSKLILEISLHRSSKFVKDICFAIYDYASTFRTEYQFLWMFYHAIHLEVFSKVDDLQQFTKSDPIFIKLLISFFRDVKPPAALQQTLITPILEVINNKNPINTNPVDIYKQWVNQQEAETGHAIGLPYDVDTDKALEYQEVKDRTKIASENMVNLASKFVEVIISNVSCLPYGIRYFSKCIYEALQEKFPDSSSDELLKVIANIIIYRFYNPAIVSPDVNVFSESKTEITPENRRNLAIVSALLQNAATGKFYGAGNDGYLSPINSYLQKASAQFAEFFKELMNIEPIQTHYNIDEFTDQTSLQKPDLKLTITQIIDIHKLLNENSDILFSNDTDMLYLALKELGDVPKPSDLVDRVVPKAEVVTPEIDEDSLGKTTIVLSLIPPKKVHQTEDEKKRALFTMTVNMIIDLLRFQSADGIKELLATNFTPQQEKGYADLQIKRAQYLTQSNTEKKEDTDVAEKDSLKSEAVAPSNKTLESVKANVVQNLALLFSYGLVTDIDDYPQITIAIAKEVSGRRQYRKQRHLEALRNRGNLDNLEKRCGYYKSQVESYNLYVKSCLDNLNKKSKKSKGSSKNRIVIKQDAAKLHAQGIILEIEGLPEGQLKNVVFEISDKEDQPGVFEVSAKFFGVQMDKIDLVFQDLLQLQYDQVSVMKLLDRAKINVNLMIFMINKKFYSKQK